MHQVKVPVNKFISPVDLPNFPYKLPILNRLLVDAMYLHGIEKALKDFDIAHVRETYFHFSQQAIKAKKRGFLKKVLVTCSETIPFNHETIWGRKHLKRQVIKNADFFHCLTSKAKTVLVAEGVPSEKICVIPYGVDLKKFRNKTREKLAQQEKSRLKLLFIGRLEAQKGIYELIKAWKKIQNLALKADLNLIGKGPLLSLIKKNNLYPETYSYNQMPQQLAKADILILPSKSDQYWQEHFGMVLLEAMASSVPIVTTNCGAIPEIVGNAAHLVKAGSSSALFKGIKLLIEHPQLRRKLAKSGLERVREYFDSQKQSQKLGKLYEKVYNS